jgi:hypothetical protein
MLRSKFNLIVENFKSELGPKLFSEIADIKQDFHMIEAKLKSIDTERDKRFESSTAKINKYEKEKMDLISKAAKLEDELCCLKSIASNENV